MNHEAKTALRVYGALAGLIGFSAIAGPTMCDKMMSADLDERGVAIESSITEPYRQEFHIKARDRGENDGRKTIAEVATQICPENEWSNTEVRIVTDRPWHRGAIICTSRDIARSQNQN